MCYSDEAMAFSAAWYSEVSRAMLPFVMGGSSISKLPFLIASMKPAVLLSNSESYPQSSAPLKVRYSVDNSDSLSHWLSRKSDISFLRAE